MNDQGQLLRVPRAAATSTRRSGERPAIDMPPAFQWGNRITNTPPNMPFPGFLNINATKDVAVSLTKVAGRHTLKMGFYNTHSYKAQQRGGWPGTINFGNDTNNPLDSQFGFANAALGIFSSYNQASAYVEGTYVYNNTEGYIQDNWKVNEQADARLRRPVRPPAAAVRHARAGVELPARQVGRRPGAGCSTPPAAPTASNPCSGTNRQAMNPLNGPVARTELVLAIGGIVPNTGNTTERAVPLRPGHRRRRPTRGRCSRSRRGSAWRTTSPATRRSSCAAAAACSSIGRAATRSTRRCRIRRPTRASPSATASCRRSAAAG